VGRISGLVLVGFLFAASAARTDDPAKSVDKKADTKQPAFVAEFQAVERETDVILGKLQSATAREYAASQTEQEREEVQNRAAEGAGKVLRPAAEKVMAGVRPHAADPAAVEPLVWVVNASGGSDVGDEAADLLRKHHLTRKQTIELAYRSKRAPMKWTEPLLRAQLAAADLPRADRPRALLALAVVRQTHSQLRGMLAEMSDDQLSQMNGTYGKTTVAWFRTIDAAQAEAEAVRLFAELAEKYGSETLFGRLTFGDVAASSIFEIRNLSVGKPAPDISGEDTDGVKFKLSDYRGKVVVLSFWGSWCGPCMALVPYERELVDRLGGKPFALIGVNSDADKAKLRAAMDEAKITWRSFWCGEKGPEGDIPSAWNVTGWPTVYVLDHKGVIRAKQVTGKALDRVVDKLVGEVDATR
jgi:thiol-disulfide isomerase/thioredoxin